MDEKAVMEIISSLEEKVRLLNEDIINLNTAVSNYQAFVDKIPKSHPDGDCEMTALEWIEWAKYNLGYDNGD